jgi:hypothetical protein
MRSVQALLSDAGHSPQQNLEPVHWTRGAMDPFLISCYRFTWSEILLIYDAAIFYHKRRPQGKTFNEFSLGLHSLLKNETNDALTFLDEDEDFDPSEGLSISLFLSLALYLLF